METGGALKGSGKAVQFAPEERLVPLQDLPEAPAGLGGALGGPRSGFSRGLNMRRRDR